MQGLLSIGMTSRDGGLEHTAGLDMFSLALFWGGVFLLAVGYYFLRTAPASKHAEIFAERGR